MPSLPAPMADSAQSAAESSGQFEAYDPGVYTARLAKVTATQTKETSNPMWSLEFDAIQDLDGNKKPGRLWTNLVIIDSVMWKVGQFFAAFGVPTTTNTDELVNHRVRLQVDKRVVTQGKRAGQEGNDISGFMPLNEGDDGFELAQRLKRSLGGVQAAPKAAAKKAAPPAAKREEAPPAAGPESPAAESGTDPWAGAETDSAAGGVDF